MILPRPLVPLDGIINHLKGKFVSGQKFQLCTENFQRAFVSFDTDKYIINCKIGSNYRKIGVTRFYCEVMDDIGLVTPLEELKLSAVDWLLMGVDGEKNVTRLAKAWAANKELLPKDNPEGANLKKLLDEAATMINNPMPFENEAAIYIMDQELSKYNTYIEQLARESKIWEKV